MAFRRWKAELFLAPFLSCRLRELARSRKFVCSVGRESASDRRLVGDLLHGGRSMILGSSGVYTDPTGPFETLWVVGWRRVGAPAHRLSRAGYRIDG